MYICLYNGGMRHIYFHTMNSTVIHVPVTLSPLPRHNHCPPVVHDHRLRVGFVLSITETGPQIGENVRDWFLEILG